MSFYHGDIKTMSLGLKESVSAKLKMSPSVQTVTVSIRLPQNPDWSVSDK